MAKKPRITPQNLTQARIARTEAYAAKIRAMFDATVQRIIDINKRLPEIPEGEMFSFDAQTEKLRAEVERALRQLHATSTAAIQQGIQLEWNAANAECDRLLKSQFGKAVVESPQFTASNKRSGAAMRAFLARSEAGMNLSDRVWQSTRQLRDEMEIAITVAVGDGTSAASLSRNIRKYLNDPDLMFRRFRYKDPETGEWKRKWKKRVIDPETGKVSFIDYDKDAYRDQWTGRGYYKSAAQNAMRVARTETNIAYRRADHDRWQGMDFVLGQRVQLSRSHPKKDICDKLAGDYPKDFVFDGWHPQCFCFVTPILMDEDEFLEMSDAEARGESYTPKSKPITDYPDNFKSWVSDNADNIEAARQRGTEPYFIRNNAGVIDDILNPGKQSESTSANAPKRTIEEIAAERHAQRTPERIEEIQTEWNRHRLRNATSGIEDLDLFTDKSFNEWIRTAEDDIALGDHKAFEQSIATLKQMVANAKAIEFGNTESLMNTPLFRANNDAVESVLGKRGTAMPFRPANELRGNPHYAEDSTYRINCQTCVVANEMRRRGFNIEALANTKGSALERLSYHTESAWLDANGNIPTSSVAGLRKVKRKRWDGTEYEVWEKTCKNRKQMVAELESAITEDGRYHIKWTWARGNCGHIITVERVNGKMRYYDPQNGRVIDDFVGYIDGIKTAGGIRYLRVDNLRVNPDIAKAVLTKPTTAKTGIAAKGGTTAKLRIISESECNFTLPNGGRVVTPEKRLAKGNLNKQEQAKFEKELRMAKRYANAGHKIEFVPDDADTFDVMFDGLKADFKSTKSPGNIVNYAKYAIREQGADIVIFEFTEFSSAYIEAINKLKALGIHGKYLRPGSNVIYEF
ncbi:MAG: toxin glutamine deamidase domain-containing protein [Roseburia sp.]|nr:toxin glutamine deamidase domain-containing protein [Roseburia sp.]